MGGRAWRWRGSLSVLGTGAALPGPALATAELLDRVEAGFPGLPRRRAEMIARRIRVDRRHVCRPFAARVEAARPGEANPDLCAEALRRALAESGLAASDLGYLIAHTATPARPLPANVALVADLVGYDGPHVELRQACTGFANALMIATGLLRDPGAPPVAIVGSETGSLFFDPAGLADADPGQLVNLVQMGDGAGAIVLGPARGRDASRDRGGATIGSAWFGALGLGIAPGLEMRNGGSEHPGSSAGAPLVFTHDFAAVADHGLALFDAGLAEAAAMGIAPAAVDRILPHQANGIIGDVLAARFGLPASRFLVNADEVGNTGSAAIWIALDALRRAGASAGDDVLVLGAEATKHMHGGFLYRDR